MKPTDVVNCTGLAVCRSAASGAGSGVVEPRRTPWAMPDARAERPASRPVAGQRSFPTH